MAGLLIYPRADELLRDLEPARCTQAQASVALGAHRDGGHLVVVFAVPLLSEQRWILATADLGLLLTAAETFATVHGDPRQCRVVALSARVCGYGTKGCTVQHGDRP